MGNGVIGIKMCKYSKNSRAGDPVESPLLKNDVSMIG